MVAFSHSVIGHNHIKKGQPNQDASLCVKDKAYTFLAVADGHGGDRYFRSDVGSRIAVESARECMTSSTVIIALKKPAREKERENIILQLKKSIVSRWNTLVSDHIDANPFTDDELGGISEKHAERYRAGEQIEAAYGSTLIAALLTDTFLLVMQIGDGNCVAVDNAGVFAMPVPACEKSFGNVTASLCDKDVIESFRHSYGNIPLAAVLIGTDGIDDCFAGAEKLYGFYRVILSSFAEKDGETAKTELIDYLPRLSEKGSGDDISIGMIADIDLLRNISFETEPETPEPDISDDETNEPNEGG